MNPAQLNLPLSTKQLESVACADARVNLWHGSIRSGKTIASLLRFLIFIALNPTGGEIVVIGRTRESIARNVFGPLMDRSLFGPVARFVQYTAGAPTARILGRTVHVLGASDARAEMVLRGLTVVGAYVDEATLVAETFWAQLLGRMSPPGAQLFATTNPDGPAHWLKRQVIDRAGELGYRVFGFRLEDNDWLCRTNPSYVEQIKREYVGLWYRRFILGEWVQAEGAVYDMWDPARHVIAHQLLPELSRVLALGVDYGTTNPTRGILLGVGQPKDQVRPRLYVVDEWAPERATDAELSKGLRGWLGERTPEPWRNPEWVFVDPAAASFKLQLFHDGMTNVANGTNTVLPGIRTIASLLATDQMQVSDRCAHLVEQLPGYAWDSKKTKKGEDAPLKVDDHEVDALRYAVHSSRALWRDLVPLSAAADTAPGSGDLEEAAA